MDLFRQNQPFQFGEQIYPRGGKYGPVLQEHITLIFLYYGEVVVKADDKTYTFPDNQAVLLYTEKILEVHFPHNQKHHVTWCYTTELNASEEAKARLKSVPVTLPPTRLLRFLLREGSKLGHSRNVNAVRLRNSMGVTLYNEYFNQAHMEEEEYDLHPAVWQARTYLEENYGKSCTLDELALAAKINPRYLVHLFKKEIGMSPIKYLWHIRGEQAMYLLLQSGLRVSEIGYRCGFKSPHHFTRFMKERYQYTPSQLRKNAWQKDPSKSELSANRDFVLYSE